MDITLTNQQTQYLLEMRKSEGENTITHFSHVFNCSKANSKYILDRMLKMGILYKDKNSYKFTVIGEDIVNKISKERDKVKASLEYLLYMNEEESFSMAII